MVANFILCQGGHLVISPDLTLKVTTFLVRRVEASSATHLMNYTPSNQLISHHSNQYLSNFNSPRQTSIRSQQLQQPQQDVNYSYGSYSPAYSMALQTGIDRRSVQRHVNSLNYATLATDSLPNSHQFVFTSAALSSSHPQQQIHHNLYQSNSGAHNNSGYSYQQPSFPQQQELEQHFDASGLSQHQGLLPFPSSTFVDPAWRIYNNNQQQQQQYNTFADDTTDDIRRRGGYLEDVVRGNQQ